MNNKPNCSICKYYNTWNLFAADTESWCDVKNCYIARPNEYSCGKFEYKTFRRLLNRLLSVRGMRGK